MSKQSAPDERALLHSIDSPADLREVSRDKVEQVAD